MATHYNVVAYDIPKLSEDGKSALPIAPCSVYEASEIEQAQGHAREASSRFDRVVLIEQSDNGPKLLERYRDGRHEMADQIVRR